MGKPAFLHLVTPENIKAEDIGDIWSAKARLTQEGYNVVVFKEEKKPRVRKKENHNVIILAKRKWNQDEAMINAMKWAKEKGLDIKVIHPKSWKDITNHKNVKEKIKLMT